MRTMAECSTQRCVAWVRPGGYISRGTKWWRRVRPLTGRQREGAAMLERIGSVEDITDFLEGVMSKDEK